MSVEYCGPVGLQFLIEAAGIDYFHRAVHISLDGLTYTDETIDELCELESLQSVTLGGTRITNSGLRRLKRALPDCRIKYKDG